MPVRVTVEEALKILMSIVPVVEAEAPSNISQLLVEVAYSFGEVTKIRSPALTPGAVHIKLVVVPIV